MDTVIRPRSVKGSWTQESLIEFLDDPQAFAPGSTMATTTKLSDRELLDLVTYLSKLR
jgi:cytochrome c2